MVHGEEEAEKAQATARGLFSGAADHENMPSHPSWTPRLSRTVVSARWPPWSPRACAAPTVRPASWSSRAASSSTARRSPTRGPVLTVDALNKGVVIEKGKKVYHKVAL